MKSWSSGFWNTNPTLRRIPARVFFPTGSSPTMTVPEVGRRRPFV